MARSTGHQGRPERERVDYTRSIRARDYSPTVKAKALNEESDSIGENLTQPSINRMRPSSFATKLKEHFSAHWMEWAVGLFLLVFGFFGYEARFHLAALDRDSSDAKAQVSELKDSMKNVQSMLAETRIAGDENRVRLTETENLVQLLVANRLRQNDLGIQQNQPAGSGSSAGAGKK